jgi:hypothetical protein
MLRVRFPPSHPDNVPKRIKNKKSWIRCRATVQVAASWLRDKSAERPPERRSNEVRSQHGAGDGGFFAAVRRGVPGTCKSGDAAFRSPRTGLPVITGKLEEDIIDQESHQYAVSMFMFFYLLFFWCISGRMFSFQLRFFAKLHCPKRAM